MKSFHKLFSFNLKKLIGFAIIVIGMIFSYKLFQYSLNEENEVINQLRILNVLYPMLPSILIIIPSFLTGFFLINNIKDKSLTEKFHKKIESREKILNNPPRKISNSLHPIEIVMICFGLIGILMGVIYAINSKGN